MLDLPDPLGPTITLTPGENSSLARSGKDLNPFISIERRYMRWPQPRGSRPGRTRRNSLISGAKPGQGLLRGPLLGDLLAPALPDPGPLGVDHGGDLEGALVGRARFVDHLVADPRAPLREQLLERRLRVRRRVDRVLDHAVEGLDDRGGGSLEAEGEKAGADQRLGHLGQRP